MTLPRAQQYKARVAEKYYLSEKEKYLLVRLELVEPARISFVAGQYISLKVDDQGVRRSYSIASTPDVNHGVTLVAEMIPGGKGSEYLTKIEIGAEVEILGPLGRFVVEGGEKHLFVATGSGIVPIKAMIEDLLINKRETRPMRLHWGMRSETDMFWFDNFMRLAEEYPNFVFDQVLSQPSPDWELCSGHVQDCLARDLVGQLASWNSYVCGNPRMVEEITAKLEELGAKPENIYHEKFS